MLNKAYGSENLRLGENVEYRKHSFVILRFGVHYSIFNLESLRDDESNSFDEAVSSLRVTGFSG
jgi:hypothetical protein